MYSAVQCDGCGLELLYLEIEFEMLIFKFTPLGGDFVVETYKKKEANWVDWGYD